MPMKQDLYQIADELRAVANAGMRWSENGYDRERYGHILKASARLVAAIEEGSEADIYTQYTGNLAHLSPLLAVEAAVFREGKILLIQRSDNQTWALPGGLLEVGESPAEGAERELWEEAGLRGKAVRLLGLLDSRHWRTRSTMQLIVSLFLIEAEGEPGLHAVSEDALSPLQEALDVGFFGEDELPILHVGHDVRVPLAFRLARGEMALPFFDQTAG